LGNVTSRALSILLITPSYGTALPLS